MDKDNNIIKPFGTLTPALRKAVDNIKQAILESQLQIGRASCRERV